MALITVSSTAAMAAVSLDDAIVAVERAFLTLESGGVAISPPTFSRGTAEENRFGVKLGADLRNKIVGAKLGSYWPGNRANGVDSHGSTVLLLDDTTGLPRAIVAMGQLNALRTAAANALAVRQLARADAQNLAILGTGRQAEWEALAVAKVRALKRVLVCGRDVEAAEALANRLRKLGLPASSCASADALRQADIVVTVTASRTALFDVRDVRTGTHISAMGADGPGKRELPDTLPADALLVADWPEQSVVVGEFQHLPVDRRRSITSLGAVLTGRSAGRVDDRQVTIFDSSGLVIQDLTMAALVLDRAIAAGAAVTVDF